MPVTRRYLCDDCEHEWTYFHQQREEPYPDCPNCARAAPASIPTSFSITGTKSKAIDYTYKMAEESYGMTNMRDNSREGDVAAIAPPPVQEREAQALTMAMKEMSPDLSDAQAEQVRDFWKTGGSPTSMAQVASPGAAAARQLGADPIEMLHKAEKATGRQGLNLDVVARAKATG